MTTHILTEDGEALLTEDGDNLVWTDDTSTTSAHLKGIGRLYATQPTVERTASATLSGRGRLAVETPTVTALAEAALSGRGRVFAVGGGIPSSATLLNGRGRLAGGTGIAVTPAVNPSSGGVVLHYQEHTMLWFRENEDGW